MTYLTDNNKFFALGCSGLQVGMGIALSGISQGDDLKGFFGKVLLSSGMNSGIYAYRSNDNYQREIYRKRTIDGIVDGTLTGIASIVVSKTFSSESAIGKIAAVVGSISQNITLLFIEAYRKNRAAPNSKEISKHVIMGSVDEGVYQITYLVSCKVFSRLLKQARYTNSIKIITPLFSSVISAISAKMALNKYERKNLKDDVLEAGGVAIVIQGGVTLVSQLQRLFTNQKLVERLNSQEMALEDLEEASEKLYKAHKKVKKTIQQIDISIQNYLANELAAYNDGQLVKNPKKIKMALLNGKTIEWKSQQGTTIDTIQLSYLDLQRYTEAQNNKNQAIHAMALNLPVATKNELEIRWLWHQHLSTSALEKRTQNHQINFLFVRQSVERLKSALNSQKNLSIALNKLIPSLKELAPHVVLVHAIHQRNIFCFNGLTDAERTSIDFSSFIYNTKDPLNPPVDDYFASWAIKSAVSYYGLLGRHLQFEHQAFHVGLIDRPHIHWHWNELVQANYGANNWENARVAILEPLTTFEDSLYHKPFGMAPYDTFTLGAHLLSKKSVILIPQSIKDQVEPHLTQFKGTIATYSSEKTLRSAIIDTLNQKEYFEDVWPICNQDGVLTGDKEFPSASGYSQQTAYIKPTTGAPIQLFATETNVHSENTFAYHIIQAKRFMGLHEHSPTDRFERNESPYFLAFKEFKSRHNIGVFENRETYAFFAGSCPHDVQGIKTLSILNLFQELYLPLMAYDISTGVADASEYILIEGIYADLASIFYQLNQKSRPFDFSIIELKTIFGAGKAHLINLLDNMHHAVKANDQPQASHFFQLYHSFLTECILHNEEAKARAITFLTLKSDEQIPELPITLPILAEVQSRWDRAQHPDLDIKNQWPIEDPMLSQYIQQLLSLLPQDPQKLRTLYHQILLKNTNNENHFKLILNLINCVLIESYYLAIRCEKEFKILSKQMEK